MRTWLARRQAERTVLAVKHEGRTLLPAFQLDGSGDVRPELRPLLRVLADGGVGGWEAWTWLTSGSSLLSGHAPEDVARTQPDRALRAAERHVAQQTLPRPDRA